MENLETLQQQYAQWQAKGLQLNMARGKPSSEQLDLSLPMLDTINAASSLYAEDGTDCRNYGVGTGLPEAKALLATMLDDVPENVIVCGASSLNIEYDMLARAWMFGTRGHAPWSTLPRVKWICPVPGYDRHFAITEAFGIEMIQAPMNDDGPDMDAVEALAADPAVKGMWCVPVYSNPGGQTYSDEVVRRLAEMPAAPDFRIFWDNAYCVHHLYADPARQRHVQDIAAACAAAGNPDRPYKFASTSKVTFPGAGISGFASSPENVAEVAARMNVQIIGHDKINQLRHVRFLKDAQGIAEHMARHAEIIAPKFDVVLSALRDAGLADLGCTWSEPEGGYFVCFVGPDNTARRIVELCAQAGVALTGAGAPFPYGDDPHDATIRLAPTLPPEHELEQAMQVFCLAAKLAISEAATTR